MPPDEPQTLGELAALHSRVFKIEKSYEKKKKKKSRGAPEKIIQEKVLEAVQALARNIIKSVYKPVTNIRRAFVYFAQNEFRDPHFFDTIRHRVEEISSYLKKINRIQSVVFDENGKDLNIEASVAGVADSKAMDEQQEIIHNIQVAEIEQVKDIVVSKMLDYLSFVTVRLEQLEKVHSAYIKEEIVREVEANSTTVLVQAKSFYRLMMGRWERKRR